MTLPIIRVPSDPDSEPRTGFYCQECEQDTFPPYPHKFEGAWHFPASGGGFYELLLDAKGSYSCSCPGYHFRGRCRHIFGTVEDPGAYALDHKERKKHKPLTGGTKTKLGDLFG